MVPHRLPVPTGVLGLLLAASLAGCTQAPASMLPPASTRVISPSPPPIGEGEKEIAVQSRYGHGGVSGVTRIGQLGPEVRMPNGTWIDCKQDCANTLREETVDFWEARVPAAAPGK